MLISVRFILIGISAVERDGDPLPELGSGSPSGLPISLLHLENDTSGLQHLVVSFYSVVRFGWTPLLRHGISYDRSSVKKVTSKYGSPTGKGGRIYPPL